MATNGTTVSGAFVPSAPLDASIHALLPREKRWCDVLALAQQWVLCGPRRERRRRDGIRSNQQPAVPVRDSIYWFVAGGSSRIIGFDLHSQMLTVISVPVAVGFDKRDRCQSTCVRAEGGGLGFLVKSGCKIQLWKRETDCDGIASWALERTIELDKLLPLDPEEKKSYILGYAEYSNVVYLWTVIGHFTLQLQSLKLEKTFETNFWLLHQPFEFVYTGGMGIGGGADLLHNA